MEFMDSQRAKEEIKKAILEELGGASSELLLDHALNPRNLGTLPQSDGQATLSGICEDTIRIQIKLKGERIEEIRFMTNGCAATVACSSMATELAKGAALSEALRIDGRMIMEALGGFPSSIPIVLILLPTPSGRR